MPLPSQIPYLIRIDRGIRRYMRVSVPLLPWQLKITTAAELAHIAVRELLLLQSANPGRCDLPIQPRSQIPLALRVRGRDNALIPGIALEPQLVGLWEDMQLPNDERVPGYRNTPVVQLDLVDTITLL